MVSEGDLVLPLLSSGGKVVAFTVGIASSEDDNVIPAITSDGKVAAMKVIPLVSEDSQGFAVVGSDKIVTPVTFGGNLVFGIGPNDPPSSGPLDLTFTDSDDDVLSIGFLNGVTLDKIGLNEGFDGFLSTVGVTAILQVDDILYCCGSLNAKRVGPNIYGNIVQYDPDVCEWKILQGTDLGFLFARDLCEFEGNLVVVGVFTDANGVTDTEAIAGWDETDWFSLGGDGTVNVLGSDVFRCLAFDGLLYVTGDFFLSSPVDPRKVKKWDGVSWEELVVGTADPFLDAPLAMVLFDDKLFLAGFGYVYSWDGTAYAKITDAVKASTLLSQVNGATVYKGDLIICGFFDSVEGVSTPGSVARYEAETSTWFPMGTGLLSTTNALADLYDVHVDQGILYASGNIAKNGDFDLFLGLAQWNPSTEKWDAAGNQDDLIKANCTALTTTTVNVAKGSQC